MRHLHAVELCQQTFLFLPSHKCKVPEKISNNMHLKSLQSYIMRLIERPSPPFFDHFWNCSKNSWNLACGPRFTWGTLLWRFLLGCYSFLRNNVRKKGTFPRSIFLSNMKQKKLLCNLLEMFLTKMLANFNQSLYIFNKLFSWNILTTLSEVSGILTDLTQTSTPAVWKAFVKNNINGYQLTCNYRA